MSIGRSDGHQSRGTSSSSTTTGGQSQYRRGSSSTSSTTMGQLLQGSGHHRRGSSSSALGSRGKKERPASSKEALGAGGDAFSVRDRRRSHSRSSSISSKGSGLLPRGAGEDTAGQTRHSRNGSRYVMKDRGGAQGTRHSRSRSRSRSVSSKGSTSEFHNSPVVGYDRTLVDTMAECASVFSSSGDTVDHGDGGSVSSKGSRRSGRHRGRRRSAGVVVDGHVRSRSAVDDHVRSRSVASDRSARSNRSGR